MSVAPLMTWLFVSTRPDDVMTRPEPAVWLPLDSVAEMLTIAGLDRGGDLLCTSIASESIRHSPIRCRPGSGEVSSVGNARGRYAASPESRQPSGVTRDTDRGAGQEGDRDDRGDDARRGAGDAAGAAVRRLRADGRVRTRQGSGRRRPGRGVLHRSSGSVMEDPESTTRPVMRL